jgi:type IV pilus assembly protein PilW
MRATRHHRGFTLVELLVGTAVGALVLTGISLVFISQAHQYQAHASRRAVQSSVRQALGFVERHVRNAGYGVDPDRAVLAYDSYDATSNGQSDGFPDGLTVHARALGFRRGVEAVSTNTLRFSQPLTQPLRKGQILLVLCPGAHTYAYVTLGATAGAGSNTVQLDTTPATADSPVSAPGQLFREQDRLADRCFHDGEPPVAVKVERASFYVAAFDDDGDPATPGTTPYLMLHRGLDIDGDGSISAADATPVAVGVEQLQVAYILNTLDDSTPLLAGVSDGVPWGETWHLGLPETARPQLKDSYRSPRRLTRHPANIRQVRLTLVARSTQPDRERAGDDALDPNAPWTQGPLLPSGVTAWRQLENLGMNNAPVAPAFDPRGGGYARAVLRSAVAPKNLLMRSQFIPINPGGG